MPACTACWPSSRQKAASSGVGRQAADDVAGVDVLDGDSAAAAAKCVSIALAQEDADVAEALVARRRRVAVAARAVLAGALGHHHHGVAASAQPFAQGREEPPSRVNGTSGTRQKFTSLVASVA